MTVDERSGPPEGEATGADGRPEALDVVIAAVEERKGEDITILDMREISGFTDYLVICQGRSERQTQAIADLVSEELEEIDRTPLHVEGYSEGNWILCDYVDFVVNIFTPETREFYQLERLWRDAPVVHGDAEDRPPVEEAAEREPETG